MARSRLDRSGRFLLHTLALPFALPMLATLLLVLLVGNRFPRDIAPGSSLALPGLLAAVAVALVILRRVTQDWPQPEARKPALLFTGLASLMAWPAWTVGVLPSVNGLALGELNYATMQLRGLDMTYGRKGRTTYYWAQLEPQYPASAAGEGRYLIPFELHETWSRTRPAAVEVGHARGLLGAEVVRDFR